MSMWRVKQFIRKWTPIALLSLALFVGYTHWQRGGRASIGSVVTSAKVAAVRLPVLGTFFRKGLSGGRSYGKSYAYKKGRKARKHRRSRRRR